jgi:hypothetical protein
MNSLIAHCESAYRSAKLLRNPFPHYIIDNFLPPETFADLVNAVLAQQALLKRQFETSLEAGKSVHGNEGMNAAANIPIKLLGGEFGSKLIGELFGIEGVSSMFDRPNFGGYYPFHQMSTGGLLGSHIDHSFSTDRQIHVANCLFYASPHWPEEWGGETILFDRTGLREIVRVQPKPNRLLVFLHSSLAFHGVDVVKCPSSHKRMSYYMDYYASKENTCNAYARDQNTPSSGRIRTWKHGTIFVPFCPLGKFQFPDFSSAKRLKSEAVYVFHYVKYLLGKMFSKLGLIS